MRAHHIQRTPVQFLLGALYGLCMAWLNTWLTAKTSSRSQANSLASCNCIVGDDGLTQQASALEHLKQQQGQAPSEKITAGDVAKYPDESQDVKVLCWVLTTPSAHKTKAVHVKATWGRRCDELLFFSTEHDSELPVIKLNVTEDRDELWIKLRAAAKYVYEHHFHEADWFFKADDDTYAVIENLRDMVRSHSPWEPIWFGCHYRKYSSHGYMSGGAGYVLSKEAFRRLGHVGLKSDTICPTKYYYYAEDMGMGECLHNLGVRAGDSRDSSGRWRFFPLALEEMTAVTPIPYAWFWEWSKYPFAQGRDCCSDTAISFHYVQPSQMYAMDYLIYTLKVGNQQHSPQHQNNGPS